MTNFILITPLLTIIVIELFLQHHHVASLSPIQQKVALFQFKQSLNISTFPTDCSYYDSYSSESYEIPPHPKTMNWSMSSDHCTWEGVSCQHNTGDVIGLDLSCSGLEGAIHPNSTLFQLSHLRFLNLSHNNFFHYHELPQEFGFFAKGLTHLNLSNTGFLWQVPSGISHLYKLVSLDLSQNYDAKLGDEVFKSILQNLTQLRVLNLYGVQIFSVLPVNLSSSLRVLDLRYTVLHGVLPQEVFHLPNIELLGLTGNSIYSGVTGLQAVLPKVKWGSSGTLQHLFLPGINIYGGIPDSIRFLESLVSLGLQNCNLSGPIPRSIGNLGQLTFLGLNLNNLNGPIPRSIGNLGQLTCLNLDGNNLNGRIPKCLANLTNLRYLDLSYNNFNGPFLSSVAHFKGLIELHLENNGFTGLLPTGLFNLPSLENLDLSNNGFTGQLYDFNSTKSQLKYISFDNNLLHGPIPQSFSQLVNLVYLDLSSNNFNGDLDMKVFSRLESLERLFLSHNSLLSVISSKSTSIPSKLKHLDLSSCNIKEFPHFSSDAEISLSWVDLSNNEIEGEIPHWIGSVTGNLNISYNRLTGGLEQQPWNNIQYLDLQSNKLNGSLSTLICSSSSLEVLNLSNNTLSGVLPSCRTNLTRLDLHSNKLNGSLPALICDSSALEVLNLSNNSLSGVLPICRTELSSLSVLDLRMNGIQGSLPSTLSNFRNLETLNLNGNRLEGRIPSSFAEFDSLQVLDLGNNQINDTFPRCLEALPNLQVLVLKSNKFHGFINKSSKVEHPFPRLRIIDLSYNDFSGPLPAIYFSNFKAMMDGNVNKRELDYMSHGDHYSDSTNLVIKGAEFVLERILTVYTTIDVSKNKFVGGIPEYIGNLVSLRFLNLSHNYLAGHIPSSVGNLSLLESLDLSSNQLEGEIPQELTRIYTLERLNLSHNQLSGRIPQGSQFNTFDNDSYGGNLGLCGNPLSKECENGNVVQTQDEDGDDDSFFGGFTWEAVVIGYGCGVVPAFIIGNLMLLVGKPKWFAGIIARELGLKIRRMEIKWR